MTRLILLLIFIILLVIVAPFEFCLDLQWLFKDAEYPTDIVVSMTNFLSTATLPGHLAEFMIMANPIVSVQEGVSWLRLPQPSWQRMVLEKRELFPMFGSCIFLIITITIFFRFYQNARTFSDESASEVVANRFSENCV